MFDGSKHELTILIVLAVVSRDASLELEQAALRRATKQKKIVSFFDFQKIL